MLLSLCLHHFPLKTKSVTTIITIQIIITIKRVILKRIVVLISRITLNIIHKVKITQWKLTCLFPTKRGMFGLLSISLFLLLYLSWFCLGFVLVLSWFCLGFVLFLFVFVRFCLFLFLLFFNSFFCKEFVFDI
jgi:hypothetical protein